MLHFKWGEMQEHRSTLVCLDVKERISSKLLFSNTSTACPIIVLQILASQTLIIDYIFYSVLIDLKEKCSFNMM